MFCESIKYDTLGGVICDTLGSIKYDTLGGIKYDTLITEYNILLTE